MSNVQNLDLVHQGAIWPDDFHDCISKTALVANETLPLPADILSRLKAETEGLLVEDSVLLEVASAVLAGNLILQGPPGTGKSTLAAAICRAFHADYSIITGREDMSAYDLIGRQDLSFDEDSKREVVVPVDGAFTDSVIKCAGAISRHRDDPDDHPICAHWLVVDELNRANIDRAFGELFSVLGTDDIVGIPLSYYGSRREVLYTPRAFRVIGTINSLDKQFVNSMSLAVRRRFTFITVDIPPQKSHDGSWIDGSSLAAQEFLTVVSSACQRVNRKLSDRTFTAENVLRVYGEKISELFSKLELVRYATVDSKFPYLPIGTAPLIDTIELFLSRLAILRVEKQCSKSDDSLDWAASAKLGPLFDVDHLDSDQVSAFAKEMKRFSPSKSLTTELKRLANAGLGHV